MNINRNKNISIGRESFIDETAVILCDDGGELIIGDYCYIGPRVKIIVNSSRVEIDDWTTLHEGSTLLGGEGCKIGQHCWFGQGTVIDSTGGLEIGNSVRVGMYSQIWSHVAAGERIDGCTLYGKNKVTIEDNAWLVGTVYVSPGVNIGAYSIVLIDSLVTKNVRANSVGGGSPYAERPKLSFYKSLTLDEKWELFTTWCKEYKEEGVVLVEYDNQVIFEDQLRGERFIIIKYKKDFGSSYPEGGTFCCLETKRYVKAFTGLEKRMIKYFSDNKIRFLRVK